MSRNTPRKRRFSVIAWGAIVVAAGGGAAFAYWTSQGTGTGSATTGTSVALQVAGTATDGVLLAPGGDASTVTYTVTNPATGAQSFASVGVSILEADGTVWNDVLGCSAADYLVGSPTVTSGTLLPGAGVDGTVTVTMIDSGSNQDGCQGADVPLYFVVG